MFKSANFLKMLILLSALAFSAAVDASALFPQQDPLASPDYVVSSNDLYTRLEVVNQQISEKIYSSMRLPETEQRGENNVTSKFKSFVNNATDIFFFCGNIENTSYSCYIQIKKTNSDRLFESPSTTSLKLDAKSDSKKWSEALPARGNPADRIISSLIIENFLETYCEKSSMNNEEICHITIYKK
ncbi:MAG: hypothetical protein AABY64_06485 [Bdellovibrionota bacterium]